MIFDSCTLAWHTGQLTVAAEEEVLEVAGEEAGRGEVKDEEVAEDEEEGGGRAAAFAEPDVLWKKS